MHWKRFCTTSFFFLIEITLCSTNGIFKTLPNFALDFSVMELHVKDSVNFSFYTFKVFLSEVHSACLIKPKLDQNTFLTEEKKKTQMCVYFFLIKDFSTT